MVEIKIPAGVDPREFLTPFYRRAIASTYGQRGSCEQAGLYADALRGQTIANAVWAAWYEKGVRPDTMAVRLESGPTQPGETLPVNWAEQWPDGSRFVAAFLFCESRKVYNETLPRKWRDFTEVVDVPSIGWDARCECSDFDARGFCSHCEAALLLAERLEKERGA